MATFDSSSKSNRLLQSKRYTMLDSDFQEVFTSVLDINSSEIYTKQASLPTSSLPYSGSSQNLQYITSGSSKIAQFWYRLEMSPSDTITSGKYLTWFTLSGSVEDVGYESQSILKYYNCLFFQHFPHHF